jgi:murein DD-endopeptidase MepM/ murein hydrolase activator NlpD
MISPYKGRFKVTQVYKGATHKGLDLVGLDDKNIYSTVNGTVEVAWWDSHPTGGMGQYVRIKSSDDYYCYYFAHLSKVFVKAQQTVKVGDLIGVEGSTGNSTGSHLHYEVRIEPSNATFLDVAKISGIPNRLGEYKMPDVPDVKETVVTIGSTVVKAKLIDGVTYAPLRELVDVLKKELEVTWDNIKGAGVKL